MTIPRGQYKSIDAVVEVDRTVIAPIDRGEIKGKVMFTLGEEVLGEYPLVALESVPEGNLWRRLSDNVQLMFE